jgi:predicted O-methyltransferase YrrM
MTEPFLVNHILGGAAHVLCDPRAEEVLDRLYWQAQVDLDHEKQASLSAGTPSVVIDDFGFPIRPQQGEFLYLIARAIGARRVFVHAVSAGAAAIYLAAAVRDNGGGVVLASDARAERIGEARLNVSTAGLSDYVELAVAEPLAHIAGLDGEIDLALLDCWSSAAPGLSAARLAIEQLAARLSERAIVVNENAEPDYVNFVRDPAGRFRTSLLPLGVVSVVTAGSMRRSDTNHSRGDRHGS